MATDFADMGIKKEIATNALINTGDIIRELVATDFADMGIKKEIATNALINTGDIHS